MEALLYLTAVLIGVALAAFFAGAETAVYSLDRVRLRLALEECKKEA